MRVKIEQASGVVTAGIMNEWAQIVVTDVRGQVCFESEEDYEEYNNRKPCVVCGTKTFCAQHILSNGQMSDDGR